VKKKPIKPIKILKKLACSVRFWFYKPEIEKMNRIQTGKKTELNRKKTEPNQKNRAKPEKNKPN